MQMSAKHRSTCPATRSPKSAAVQCLQPRLIIGIQFSFLYKGMTMRVAVGNLIEPRPAIFPTVDHRGQHQRWPAFLRQMSRPRSTASSDVTDRRRRESREIRGRVPQAPRQQRRRPAPRWNRRRGPKPFHSLRPRRRSARRMRSFISRSSPFLVKITAGFCPGHTRRMARDYGRGACSEPTRLPAPAPAGASTAPTYTSTRFALLFLVAAQIGRFARPPSALRSAPKALSSGSK